MELFRHSPIMGPKQRLHEPIIVVSLSGAERTDVDLSKRAFRSITPLSVPRSCGVPNQAHLNDQSENRHLKFSMPPGHMKRHSPCASPHRPSDQSRAGSRTLDSMSISRPRSCLRATNSARTSCEPIDLACTGRNQPIRISWASPRASLRSVFTIIADNAAFTCRVSSRRVSNPARFSPACSHCDNGPASSPIRFTAKPSDAKKATRDLGLSLATFASLTILPCASTSPRWRGWFKPQIGCLIEVL